MSQSRTVVNALLRKGIVERVGLYESMWGETLTAWVQQGYPTRTQPKVGGEASGETVEKPAWPEEHFGYDIYMRGGFFDLMPLRGQSKVVSETDEWEIRKNGAGASLKWWKHKSGTPEHVAFSMDSYATWLRDYRPHLVTADPERLKDMPGHRAWMARVQAQNAWMGFSELFVWEIARSSLGDVTLYESLLLDPGWIRDFCRVYTDFFKTHFSLVFEQLGKPDGMMLAEDLGFSTGLFASPEVLKDLIFPFYAELVAFFHDQGLPVILHSCGSVVDALPMIVEAGFDALNPMERKAVGNDPFLFAERYGDRLAFVGGLDARILETNDLDLISRETIHYIEGMKARGARLIFGSDHSLSPRVRYDSYRCALDVYREHMWY